MQGAFAVDRGACLPGAVLLVDDTVDSKWTITEAGGALRKAGAPAVVPFTLGVGDDRQLRRRIIRRGG